MKNLKFIISIKRSLSIALFLLFTVPVVQISNASVSNIQVDTISEESEIKEPQKENEKKKLLEKYKENQFAITKEVLHSKMRDMGLKISE